jgi:hypothetical protein
MNPTRTWLFAGCFSLWMDDCVKYRTAFPMTDMAHFFHFTGRC